ncbi:MAG TPA: DUF4335 domain-containing protein [Cyanobacteria bacterium UBA12227]|nr:DUF4335 domain-containing protein [Cyanobacteria bacterium UBA12227]HAX85795.1 DUF4335 domain-containing protein [Cyanobacteria bacterium UBA11370]HBY78303.1 DUF4335 domain-containing protein [Cyanobacteria bacterium UBA11148]
MTIRRQYSLPNCTLILEGLNDGTLAGGSQLDTRPLMTILVNAECSFTGHTQPISGGRDFFESLVRSVSHYAQEFLSKVPHPRPHGDQPPIVQLQPLSNKHLHRLTVLPSSDGEAKASGGSQMGSGAYSSVMEHGTGVQLDLTTVQLFDLVEAIDQFLADQRTLPDLNVPLQPVSRRYRKADQPIAQRAAPAAVGMTSLAVAAIAFFLVPVPEVRPPQPKPTETTSANPDTEGQATPQTTPPSTSELEKAVTSAREITDPTELYYLKRNLYRTLNERWDEREQVNENLEYQVGVGKDGKIVGYKPVENTPAEASDQTPLQDLLYIPPSGSTATQEPLAQFRVVFTKRGVLQVSPWQLISGEPGLGPEITDSTSLRELNDKVYQELSDRWQGTPLSPKPLEYRVGVTQEGIIADYEPINQPAWDYVQETPLEKLLKPEAAGIGSKESGLVPQKPLGQFRVVFKPNGVLEVSPLRGR